MHDLDRTTLESNLESDAFDPYPHEAETLGEHELGELAGELLDVSSEHELEHFLDKIIGAFGGLTSSLTKQFKPLARRFLHGAGPALAQMFAPGVGSAVSAVSAALGLELEGLSSEEQEFHVAHGLVALLADVIRHASQTGGADPRAIARAFQAAAQRHAPGLMHVIAEHVVPATPAAFPAAPAAMSPPTAPAPHGPLMTEADEMELAGELLEVRSESEVDHFLHGLIGAAEQLIGKALGDRIRPAVAGHAKQIFAERLPRRAHAIAATIGGAGSAPDAISHDEPDGDGQGERDGSDAEYEAARSVVRAITDATSHALAAAGGDPLTVARQAFERVASSLAGPRSGRGGGPAPGVTATEGRWFRQDDDHIVVVLGK